MPRRSFSNTAAHRCAVDEHSAVALRNQYLIKIAELAVLDRAAPLVVNAQELLKSRYWAKSTRRERSKILDTVGWLLRSHRP